MTKLSRANAHALEALGELGEGQYFVVVLEDFDLPMGAPFVCPTRGAAFMLDGKWMVFSPVENAN